MLFKINKEEAVRIIKLLPIMKPGELNGKKVTVKYILPMEVEVQLFASNIIVIASLLILQSFK